MGEPSAVTKIHGDGFVSKTEDATEDAIAEWAQQGYSLSQNTEDGFSVFRFNGERHAENEDSAALNPVVEDADIDSGLVPTTGDPVILKGERAIPLQWTYKFIQTENFLLDENDKTFTVPGTDQDVDVSVLLYFAADSNEKKHTGFVMKVEQAVVTVTNSKNDKTHRGHFLTRLEVKASPVRSTMEIVDGVKSDVSDVLVPAHETFSKQKSSTTSGTGGFNVPFVTGSLGGSSGRSVTSNSRFHGWNLGRNGREQSVTWIWELEHWADGQAFHFDAPARVNIKMKDRIMLSPVLPELPDPYFKSTTAGQVILKRSPEAEWLVLNDKLQGVKEFEWDVQVNFYTASVKVMTSFGKPEFRLGNEFKTLRQKISLELT